MEGEGRLPDLPKSFKDSNGDGVGDLKESRKNSITFNSWGLIFSGYRLFTKSPFIDQGYDISDYYAIDPLLGAWKIWKS